MVLGSSKQVLTTTSEAEAKKLPQYVAALSATMGGLVMGSVLGWGSPAGPNLELGAYGFPVSKDDTALMGGLVPLGAMVGALVGGPSADLIGRRYSLLTTVVHASLGWLLIIFATSVGMMFAGRVVLGFSAGFLSVVAPLYTNEISQISIRGTLGTYFQLQVVTGILFSYVVGAYDPKVVWLSVACAVFPLVLGGLMLFMPESPKAHLKKGRTAQAAESLRWLRGASYDITAELAVLQDDVQQTAARKLSLKEAFSSRSARMGLAIGMGVMLFQQLGGVNAIIFYTVDIFIAAGSSMDPNTSTIVVGSISVGATYLSTLVVDRLGRKPLLLFSGAVCALSCVIIGVFYFLKDGHHDVSSIGWLPLTFVSVFLIVFSLGYGPIPWMFMSEIFPPEVMGPACAVACLFNWLCAFLVTMFFSKVSAAIGVGPTFWGFAGISTVGVAFVWLLVPETKGRTLAEVTAIIGGNRDNSWL